MQKINLYLITLFTFILCFPLLKSQEINHWELVISAEDTWSYFIGNSEPPTEWIDKDFDPSSWLSGPGGIGYEDGDDLTVIEACSSVYIRKAFNVTDNSKISMALLYVDFDDAFVAYLNGHEIARINIGTPGTRPTYDELALNCDYEAQLPTGGTPARFIIPNDSLSKYLETGDNVLALQVHNCDIESSDLSSSTFLVVGINDDSQDYRELPVWFQDPLQEKSLLPLVVIDTWGQTIPDDPKITAWIKVIDNGLGQENNFLEDGTDYEGYMGIEIRGQSSQMFPKKSYGFELRDGTGSSVDSSILGMPAENDWILYAPYSDKSLMRNSLTYFLGSKMGTWQPRWKFCEVYLNGNYHGIYVLVEKIKRGADRVDINKLKPDEISGDDLTGGYIVKVDKTWDLSTDEYFYTHPTNTYHNARNYAFTYEYPDYDEIVSQQKEYIAGYLEALENTLNGDNFTDPSVGFRKYLDINSFVDFQIIQELGNNVDGYRYSTFFYKKKDSDGGKLFAGPLWDFDLSYGNVDYSPLNLATDQWLFPHYGPDESYPMHWWSRLMEDPDYRISFVNRWQELRNGAFKTDTIMKFLDDTIQYLGTAVERNFQQWPILGQYIWPNYFVGNTYPQEIDYLKQWINNRLEWMDNTIEIISSIGEEKANIKNMLIYPNPVKNQLNFIIEMAGNKPINISLFDLQGKKVFDKDINLKTDRQQFTITIPSLVPAYYILKLNQEQNTIATKKLFISN